MTIVNINYNGWRYMICLSVLPIIIIFIVTYTMTKRIKLFFKCLNIELIRYLLIFFTNIKKIS